jgi:hypothetical protein
MGLVGSQTPATTRWNQRRRGVRLGDHRDGRSRDGGGRLVMAVGGLKAEHQFTRVSL